VSRRKDGIQQTKMQASDRVWLVLISAYLVVAE